MSDPVAQWEADCLRTYGKVLSGEYAHWCCEWDDLPIDETTEEFEACMCFPDDTYAAALRFMAGMARPVPPSGNGEGNAAPRFQAGTATPTAAPSSNEVNERTDQLTHDLEAGREDEDGND